MLKRLVTLRGPVTTVCSELGWDGLLNSDWATLDLITRLLEPFARYTQLVTAAKRPTFSAVIPIINELRLHLGQVLYF